MNTSTPFSRRRFLRETSAATLGAALAPWPRALWAAGANERVTLAIIGPGGMGTNLLKSFAAMNAVAIAFVCDPDAKRAEAAAANVEKIAGRRPRAVADLRRVLESKD